MIAGKTRLNKHSVQRPRIIRGLCFLLILISLLSDFIYGQEFLLIHENVGYTLDLDEKIHYKLFPEIDNFYDAQFFEMTPETIGVKMRLWEQVGYTTLTYYMPTIAFYQMRASIASQPPLTNALRQKIHQRFQPLYTEQFLQTIPDSIYCRIKTTDKQKYEGLFYRNKGDYVQIWFNKKIIAIPKNKIVTLKYWPIYHEQAWPIYFTTITGGFIGLSLAYGAVNIVPLSRADQVLVKIGSTAVGTVLGSHFAPIINEMTLPAVKIEFRRERIKRLDIFYRTYYTLTKIKERLWRIIAE